MTCWPCACNNTHFPFKYGEWENILYLILHLRWNSYIRWAFKYSWYNNPGTCDNHLGYYPRVSIVCLIKERNSHLSPRYWRNVTYNRKRRTNPKIWFFPVSSCSCLCPIHWSQVLSREWRCSHSIADRRRSNYIWVINRFIAYYDAAYIRGLTLSNKYVMP